MQCIADIDGILTKSSNHWHLQAVFFFQKFQIYRLVHFLSFAQNCFTEGCDIFIRINYNVLVEGFVSIVGYDTASATSNIGRDMFMVPFISSCILAQVDGIFRSYNFRTARWITLLSKLCSFCFLPGLLYIAFGTIPP